MSKAQTHPLLGPLDRGFTVNRGEWVIALAELFHERGNVHLGGVQILGVEHFLIAIVEDQLLALPQFIDSLLHRIGFNHGQL